MEIFGIDIFGLIGNNPMVWIPAMFVGVIFVLIVPQLLDLITQAVSDLCVWFNKAYIVKIPIKPIRDYFINTQITMLRKSRDRYDATINDLKKLV